MNRKLKLTRVGVTRVKKPLTIRRPGKVVTLTGSIDVFVDLPWSEKSSHLSRNLEALNEVIDEGVRNPADSIEELAARTSRELLKRHEYANHSETSITADYFLEKTSPKGRKSLESYKLMSRTTAERNGSEVRMRRAVGVEVMGMTACPCAMETIKEMMKKDLGMDLSGIPTITHNQRNVTTIMMDSPEGYDIEADDLIDIVEASISSPTYEILKRDDEAELTINAHRNPRFVEDVVREILNRILEKYGGFPDDVTVAVKSESEESIHKHNAYAERTTTLGELRK
jgi:GTP cyclohydrolase-4